MSSECVATETNWVDEVFEWLERRAKVCLDVSLDGFIGWLRDHIEQYYLYDVRVSRYAEDRADVIVATEYWPPTEGMKHVFSFSLRQVGVNRVVLESTFDADGDTLRYSDYVHIVDDVKSLFGLRVAQLPKETTREEAPFEQEAEKALCSKIGVPNRLTNYVKWQVT